MTSKTIQNQSKINHKLNPTAQQPQYRKTNKFGDSSTFFIDFSYSSLSMLRSKINKNGAKIPSKTSAKSTPQLASILVPIWLHFGRVLGAKLAPNRSQSRCTKISTKMITFWIALGSNFHGFWPPFGSQDGTQNPHLGAKIGPRPPKVGAKIGSKPQLGAKMAPRPSQDTSRDRF